MQYIRSLLLKWFQAPSVFELSVLYVLLGFYLSVATDAVIPFCWITFTLVSLGFVVLTMCFRLIFFFILALGAGIPKKNWAKWAQLGFIALMTGLIFMTNIDLSVRLKIGESSLLNQVDMAFTVYADTQGRLFETGPVPSGLFAARMYKIDATNRTVWFHTEDGSDPFWVPSALS